VTAAVYPFGQTTVAVLFTRVTVPFSFIPIDPESFMSTRSIFLMAFCVMLPACGGTMQGVIRGAGTPVAIAYEQGMVRDYYTTTIDGEAFSGQAVADGASSNFGTVFANGNMGTVVMSSTSGDFVAVMIGNRGSSIRCQMNYADSSGLTNMGGVGVCQHSDGRIIDVMW
jgi:hypothetical protein